MSLFLRIDINIVAMLLLGTILFIACGRLAHEDELNRLFLKVSYAILLGLFFETTTCILNGMAGVWVAPAANLLHIGLFTSAPILSYCWYRFICRWIYPRDMILPQNLLLLLPVIIVFLLAVLSPFYGFIFQISGVKRLRKRTVVRCRGSDHLFLHRICYGRDLSPPQKDRQRGVPAADRVRDHTIDRRYSAIPLLWYPFDVEQLRVLAGRCLYLPSAANDPHGQSYRRMGKSVV